MWVLMWCLASFVIVADGQENVLTIFSLNGVNWSLSVGNYPEIAKTWQNTAISLKVTPGYEFVGYTSENFNGEYMIWDEDTNDMGNMWKQVIRSCIVRIQSFELTKNPQPHQTIGRLCKSLNNCTSGNLQPGEMDLTFGNVTSIMLTPGYEMSLFDGQNQTGNCLTYSHDEHALNLLVISYSIQKKMTTMIPIEIPTTNDTTITPPNSTRSTSSTRSDTSLIAGTISGGIIAIGLLFYFLGRRCRDKKATPNKRITSSVTVYDADVLNMDELLKYRLEPRGLHLERIIGYGSFAEIWRGTYNGEIVAVKKLQSIRCANSDIQDFIDEIALTASFNCTNIISIVGVIWTSPSNIKAVMEFMDLGDLRGYLVKNSPMVFTWDQKRQLLLSVADGLAYLHSFYIIHRDLKSRSILLDSNKGVKMADFGATKEDIEETMTRGIGTFRWMAPEVLKQTSYTIAADIYSFGVILSELDKHCIPYHDMKNATGIPLADAVIIRDVMNGVLKPTFTDYCPEWVKALADSCLQFDPNERPKIRQIISILNNA